MQKVSRVLLAALGTLYIAGHGLPSASPTALAQPPPAPPAATTAAAGDEAGRMRDLVAAPDRSEADRALDGGRRPAELLAFLGVRPGMRVAELGAGGGYTSELLARAVGETGRVYAQNPKVFLERFAEGPWSERLKKPVMSRVVRVDREFDDPLPAEAKNLDLVVMVLIYH